MHLSVSYAILELPAPVTTTRILSLVKDFLQPYPRGIPVVRPCRGRLVVFKPALHILPKLIDALRPDTVRYIKREITVDNCRPSRPPFYKVTVHFGGPFLRRVPGGLTSSVPESYFLLKSIVAAATGDRGVAKTVASRAAPSLSMVYLNVRKKEHIEHKGTRLFGFVGEAEYTLHGCPALLEILKLAEDVGVGDSPGLGFGCDVRVEARPLLARLPAVQAAATAAPEVVPA